MKFGLSPDTIQQIHSVFAQYASIEKAIIYGSRAKGNYKKASDIDLTLLGNSLTYQDLLHIFDDLDELLLPYTIDLSIFTHIQNPNLVEHIQRVGILFYEKEKQFEQN